MNPSNTEELYQTFPHLYRRQMPYGFECEDGWFDLIFDLSQRLTDCITQHPECSDVEVVQVKQKFGGLCYYFSDSSKVEHEMLRTIVRDALERARSICELDGNPATGIYVCTRWYRCLCEPCATHHDCLTYEEYQRQARLKAAQTIPAHRLEPLQKQEGS